MYKARRSAHRKEPWPLLGKKKEVSSRMNMSFHDLQAPQAHFIFMLRACSLCNNHSEKRGYVRHAFDVYGC